MIHVLKLLLMRCMVTVVLIMILGMQDIYVVKISLLPKTLLLLNLQPSFEQPVTRIQITEQNTGVLV